MSDQKPNFDEPIPTTVLDEPPPVRADVAAATANAALEATAKATIQARFAMALQRPRDPDLARERLLKECRRSGFAQVATWSIPNRGRGFSIRFAEAALRCWGNVGIDALVLYDDAERRVVNLTITDYEAPLFYTRPLVIQKVVERREVRKGQVPRGIRANSDGQRVYLIEATDQDVAQKQGSEISKAIRAEGLRLIPGDILDECRELLRETLAAKAAKDPDAARKQILDGFAALHVSAAALKEFVGRELTACSPAELEDLRGIWQAIKDGETTWPEVVAAKEGDEQEAKPKTSRTEEVKERLKKGAAPPTEPQVADPDLEAKVEVVKELTELRAKRKVPTKTFNGWVQTLYGTDKLPEDFRLSHLPLMALKSMLAWAQSYGDEPSLAAEEGEQTT